jgi:precorrin-6B methylase 2
MLYFGILFASLAAIFTWLFWPIIIGAPWVPTPMKAVKRMLEIAKVKERDVVIDLGSGDGRIIITAAKEFKARAIGIEADPLRLIWSKRKIRKNGFNERVKVLWGNFLDKDLEEATVVTIYQGQEINNKLKPKFEKELKPGTRVVSHVFTFDGWEPNKVDRESQVYLYLV